MEVKTDRQIQIYAQKVSKDRQAERRVHAVTSKDPYLDRENVGILDHKLLNLECLAKEG